MKVGTSRFEITPQVGVQLCGFVSRDQPSTGVRDPLFARCVYLEDSDSRLLWVHADAFGFESQFVDRLKGRLRALSGVASHEIVVTASHTHCGPPTMPMNGCGEIGPREESYLRALESVLVEAGQAAMVRLDQCAVQFGESTCGIARDRRGGPQGQVDRRVAAVSFVNPEGRTAAVLANYAVHPASLGPGCRQISGDLFGLACLQLEGSQNGGSRVVLANGACGNLDPPAVGMSYEEAEDLALELSVSVSAAVEDSVPVAPALGSAEARLKVGVQSLSAEDARRRAALVKADAGMQDQAWTLRAIEAVERWERTMKGPPAPPEHLDLRLQAIRIGPLRLACFGSEVFSSMSGMLCKATGERVAVVGYANGNIGYLAPEAAYDEGGYEVDSAFVYYNSPPILRGSFEVARDEMVRLISCL